MNKRTTIVFGIAALVLVATIVYAIVQVTRPYKGLILTQDVEMTEEERTYVEHRIAVTMAALDAQKKADEKVDLDLYLSLAWDYTVLGDLVHARKTYDEYFEHNAINYTAWANYGMIARRMGDIEAAEEAYIKALTYNPTEANYRNYITLLQNYFEGTRDDEVLSRLQEGVTRVGQTSWFMVTLAEYYKTHGNCQAAFEHYEAAIALAPDITAIVDDYNLAKSQCQ